MWGFHDGMGWWMLFAGLWTVVLLVSVFWLLAAASRAGGGNRQPPPAQEQLLDMAKRRLAQGEITLEQYEEIKRVIERP